MGRRLIRILIFLAVFSVAGIIATQIYWLNKAFDVQETQFDLRQAQATAESKQFNDRITIALTNVANEILTINNDPAELFQSVKQIRPNYFTVAINDTVHPYLLESLLKSEFERRNINENFEYGIYDCFTDSIVYGDYVALNADTSASNFIGESPQIKWDKDGHYFGVFFPDKESFDLIKPQKQISTWAFSALISLIVFTFFAYAVFLILRQKRLSEMKTDFINNMTHELKTPISTIGLSSEILRKEGITDQPERVRNYANLIHDENQRLKLQVDRVLQLATLEKEKIALNFQPLDMHTMITHARASIALVRDDQGASISLDLKAAKHSIKGDSVHISNIIHNLLDNALKYSLKNSPILIATENQGSKLIISIADQGIGIPKKSIPFIFDKFYRVPTGNRHDVKGFGLGLFYVKQMVESHKGKIKVESKEKEGTTFQVIFETTEQ